MMNKMFVIKNIMNMCIQIKHEMSQKCHILIYIVAVDYTHRSRLHTLYIHIMFTLLITMDYTHYMYILCAHC